MFTYGFLINVNGRIIEHRVTNRLIKHEAGSLNIEWDQLAHQKEISLTCTGEANHTEFRCHANDSGKLHMHFTIAGDSIAGY